MPVNLAAPDPASLLPVAGVRLGIASAGIKKPGRRDITLIELAPGSRVAGVFTQNRFCAAPVTLCKQHLGQIDPSGDTIRALVINTGNANAGTGEEGLDRARRTCVAVAGLFGIKAENVLPFSTGVILEPLPIHKILPALPAPQADLRFDRAGAGLLSKYFPGADFSAESMAASCTGAAHHPGTHADAESRTAANLDANGGADIPAVGHASARYACADTHAVEITHADQESGPAHEVAI